MGSRRDSAVNDDFRNLLSAFVRAEVRFLVVGGYAVGIHGRPRATKDLDLWVDCSAANSRRVLAALAEFGAPLGDLQATNLSKPGKGFKMGTVSPLCTPPPWTFGPRPWAPHAPERGAIRSPAVVSLV